jgi:hypothetical protein
LPNAPCNLGDCFLSKRGFQRLTALAALTAGFLAGAAWGQTAHESTVTGSATTLLPDAPGSGGVNESSDNGAAGDRVWKPRTGTASRLDKVIEPTETAPRLDTADKILLGMRSSVSLFTAVGWVASAGYAQATDGPPNYGHQGKAFAQRLGAAAARDASEDIFTDAVLAPVLHEDPRYYVIGGGHNPAARGFYAISRVFVTRTDGGRQTLNLSLLGGNLAGAAMTQAYYPALNRGFNPVVKTFGTGWVYI